MDSIGGPVKKTQASTRQSTGNTKSMRSGSTRQGFTNAVSPRKTRMGSSATRVSLSRVTSPASSATGTSTTGSRRTSESSTGSSNTPKNSRPSLIKRLSGQLRQRSLSQPAKGKPEATQARAEAIEAKVNQSPFQSGSTQSTPGKGSAPGKGIRTRLSTGSIHMNGTTTVSAAKEKAELDMIIQQISKSETTPSQKSGGGKKRSSSSQAGAAAEAHPDHPPPKKRKIGRNDGSGEDNRNDYFCWMCHKEGTLVCCELCPRVYHIRCLGLMGELPQDWVCPECEKIMRAECVDTRSKAMEMLSLDQLCILLKYALERMKHQGSDPFKKAVDPTAVPNYSDYIFYPMDLAALEKNIKKKQYGCTEALLADARWIQHNCIIYNGAHHSLTNSAKMIVKICKHETNEIELCPDCYLNSCIRKNDEWFSEPCRVPHTLVWAKLKGYPFWPAKALRELDGQVDVRFFGAHDRSWVPVSQCFLLSKNIPTSLQKGKKNAGLSGAISELHIHINKLRENFGGFEYAPFRTPYDKTDSYKPTNLRLPSSMPFSPKSGQNQQKKSVAAKTASAVKSKYSLIVSIKKSETTPKKVRKDNATGVKSESVDQEAVSPAKEVVSEKEHIDTSSVTGVAGNSEQNGDSGIEQKPALPGHNDKTDSSSGKPLSTGKQKSDLTNTAENVTEKKSVLPSSIVDRLAKKIKALNEEEPVESEAEQATFSNDTAVGNKTVEGNLSDKEETTSQNIQEGDDNSDKACAANTSETSNVESTVEAKHRAMEEKSELNVLSKNQTLEEKESESIPDSCSKSEIKNVLDSASSVECSSETKSTVEDKTDHGTENINSTKDSALPEKEKEPCENEKEFKESYKKKLESTILSCRAKLGIEDSSSEKTDDESDDIPAEQEMNEDSDGSSDSDAEEEFETAHDSEDSDSSAMLDMEVDEIVSGEEVEPDTEDGDTDADKQEGIEQVSEKHSTEIKHTDKTDITAESINNSSEEVCREVDEAVETASSPHQDITSEKVDEAGQNDTSITCVKNSISVGEKTNDSSGVGHESEASKEAVTSVSESTKECTQAVKPVKTSVDNFSVPVNAKTVQASLQQILAAPVSCLTKAAIGKESVVKKVTAKETSKPLNLKEKKLPTNSVQDNADIENMEDDSESERLVIDLGTDSDASPMRSKVCVKGKKDVSVKNNSDRRNSSSSLVIDPRTTKPVIADKQDGSCNSKDSAKTNVETVTTGEKSLAKTNIQTVSAGEKSLTISMKTFSPVGEQTGMDVDDVNLNEESLNKKSTVTDKKSSSTTPGSIATSLAEKFSIKLMSKIQTTVDEMCAEMLHEKDADKLPADVQKVLDQARWDYSAELNELKHNFELTITEMKGCWEAEKEQQNIKHKAELEKQVRETKKKQWCAQCGKEAIFYCCWNTSYCDYPCQQSHWPKHLSTCLQTNKDGMKTLATTNTTDTSVTSSTLATPQVMTSTAGPTTPTDLTSKTSIPPISTSNVSTQDAPGNMRQRIHDSLSAAIYREEEKRGEARTGVSPKYVPMSSPVTVIPNPRQGTPSTLTGSLLFPNNLASSGQMVHPPQPTMMQPIPRNMFINQQIPMPQRMSVAARQVNNNLLLSQPVLQQQALYPVQLPQQQQHQQQLGGPILFQNTQQHNLMGYGMRPPF